MSGILNTLLIVGVLVGGVIAFQHRCDWFQFCGALGAAPAAATEAAPVAEDTPVPAEGESGGVDESASNLNEQGNWDRQNAGSKGCCTCSMQGGRVKCSKHGGAYYNPPALGGQSNDQSIELSLQSCNATCGSNSTSPTDRERREIKATTCPRGQTSVNGKCVTLGAGRGKGGGVGGSQMSRAPRQTRTGTGSGKGGGGSGTSRQAAWNNAVARAKASRYASVAQYAQAYFSQSGLRPYRAFGGRLSL